MLLLLLDANFYLMLIIFRRNLFKLRDGLTIFTAVDSLFLLVGASQLIRAWTKRSLRADWFVPFLHGLKWDMLLLTPLQMTRLRNAIPVIRCVFLANSQQANLAFSMLMHSALLQILDQTIRLGSRTFFD